MKKGKLLIVSWTLHPWPSGSSVIVNNIASKFSQDELILFGEEYPKETNLKWEDDYPKIVYTNPNITFKGRGQTYLRWWNIRRVINEISQLVKKESVDKILCIYPDEFYLFASYIVSKQMDIPMYSWFHNTFSDNLQGIQKMFAQWFQPRIFKHCKVNFVMSDGMKNFYYKKYPETEFITLPHGFELPKSKKYSELENQTEIKRFIYTGNLSESCRDATIRILKVILAHPNYHVDAYCGTTYEQFQRWGIDSPNFKIKGFIPLSDLYERLKEYDVLLLPHGFDGGRTKAEFDTIFPTRTIPLLISGRPILAHSPPGVFLSEFLEQNKCALNVDTKKVEMIEVAISKLLNDEDYSQELVKNAFLTSQYFEIDNVINTLKKKLEA